MTNMKSYIPPSENEMSPAAIVQSRYNVWRNDTLRFIIAHPKATPALRRRARALLGDDRRRSGLTTDEWLRTSMHRYVPLGGRADAGVATQTEYEGHR